MLQFSILIHFLQIFYCWKWKEIIHIIWLFNMNSDVQLKIVFNFTMQPSTSSCRIHWTFCSIFQSFNNRFIGFLGKWHMFNRNIINRTIYNIIVEWLKLSGWRNWKGMYIMSNYWKPFYDPFALSLSFIISWMKYNRNCFT